MFHLLAMLAQQSTEKPSGGIGDMSLPILMFAILGIAYFLLIRPMKQREKKERENLLANLKKNDEVVTLAGIIGIVAMIKDDEVVLKVDESSNVRMRVLKSAIARILNSKDSPTKDAQSSDSVKAGSPPADK